MTKERKKDIFVVIFCLTGALVSLNFFRMDLFQTIAAKNVEPVGTVTIRSNNVQRRFSDRVIWGRLFVESPVYLGDLIRLADHSSATLHINGSDIDLNENTLIRILAADEDGKVIIDLSSGSLNLASGTDIEINLSGRRIEAAAGTVLTAAATEEGVSIQVSEGSIEIIEESGESRSLNMGEVIVMDTEGVEQAVPAAVVFQPRSNARFLKNSGAPLNINFAWNTINIEPNQTLLLEISQDRSFSQVARSVRSANTAAVGLEEGQWHWRLLLQDTVLSTGQISVVNAVLQTGVSPAQDSLFTYSRTPPTVRFEWQELEGASYYILEAGLTPDLQNPRITRNAVSTSVVDSSLSEGTWYWRVLPVFPSNFEGIPSYSPVASFRVEQIVIAQEPQIEPEPVPIAAVPEPEPLPLPTPQPEAPPQQQQQPQRPAATPPPAQPRTNERVPTPAYQPAARQPEQLLPAPRPRMPANEHRITIDELRETLSLNFSWTDVSDANSYIFSLYHQGPGGRRQIVQTEPQENNSWTMDDLGLLDQGTFIWHAEAIRINTANGTIEQRGRISENSFIVEIPIPAVPETVNIEFLYEN